MYFEKFTTSPIRLTSVDWARPTTAKANRIEKSLEVVKCNKIFTNCYGTVLCSRSSHNNTTLKGGGGRGYVLAWLCMARGSDTELFFLTVLGTLMFRLPSLFCSFFDWMVFIVHMGHFIFLLPILLLLLLLFSRRRLGSAFPERCPTVDINNWGIKN